VGLSARTCTPAFGDPLEQTDDSSEAEVHDNLDHATDEEPDTGLGAVGTTPSREPDDCTEEDRDEAGVLEGLVSDLVEVVEHARVPLVTTLTVLDVGRVTALCRSWARSCDHCDHHERYN
jgi:hypothetical protein